MERVRIAAAWQIILFSLAVFASTILSLCGAAEAAEYEHACAAPSGTRATCYALVDKTEEGVKTYATGSGVLGGFDPSDLRSAYKLPSSGGSGQTVAIVDAYNDPNAESDLAIYRAHYGLSECGKSGGCFKKVNQKGEEGSYPKNSTNWSEEISVDVDMVSAICASCHILLVEANSAEVGELAAAVNEAAKLGVTEISNSYGIPEQYEAESKGFKAYDSDYTHAGIPTTVAAGDAGYENWEEGVRSPSFPAAAPNVIAVGGTTLVPSEGGGREWTETVWAESGGGCSTTQSKPAWQSFYSGCTHRLDNDVAAVGDPATPVSVYDTYELGQKWHNLGGTSVGAPLIAAVEALSSSYSRSREGAEAFYLDASHLFDITAGTNFPTEVCSPLSRCNAASGFDGPSGNGTPHGPLELIGPPENTAPPVVSPSTPDQAVAESTSTGTWTHEPTGYTYQWERCNATGGECSNIEGATGASYTPGEADVEHTLVAKVTAKTSEGSTTAASKATSAVKPVGLIAEYALPKESGPGGIAAGPDGNLWFTNYTSSKVGKVTTAGTVTEYALPKESGPFGIAAGSDGNLWFTDLTSGKIGKLTTAGAITEYALPAGSRPYLMAAGPDHNLWFTAEGTSKIGKITTAGAITEYALPAGSEPSGIAAGPDGDLWFTDYNTNKIGKISTTGAVTEYALPAKSKPIGVAAGPDGDLWFTDYGTSEVGKSTTSGTISEYPLDEKSGPFGITAGPDGNLWVTAVTSSEIDRVTIGGAITEYALPAKSGPSQIAVGSDGNLWFADDASSKLARITP